MKLEYYNLGHLSLVAFPFIFFFSLLLFLKSKTEHFQTNFLLIMLAINFVLFVSYKIVMGFSYDTFEVLNELPLHLCNLNTILLPLAIKLKKKPLMSYLYFIGVPAAMCGVLFFDTTFLGKDVLSYAVIIYFFYHSMLMWVGLYLPLLKFLQPKLKDIGLSLSVLTCLMLIMHVVNVIFRATQICLIANYFYTFGMEGNPILGSLFSLIPVPVLYLTPLFFPVALVNFGMYLPFRTKKPLQSCPT